MEVLLLVRIWNAEKWTLSPLHQFIVNKRSTLRDIGKLIQDRDGSVTIEDMEACRILAIQNFQQVNLLDELVTSFFKSIFSSHKLYSGTR